MLVCTVYLTLLSSPPLFPAYDCEFYNKGKRLSGVLCSNNFELCGLKVLPICSSGERSIQADHLQGQDDTCCSQRLRWVRVPPHQHHSRSPVSVHDDAWPQQSPSSRWVTSVHTAGFHVILSCQVFAPMILNYGKTQATVAEKLYGSIF